MGDLEAEEAMWRELRELLSRANLRAGSGRRFAWTRDGLALKGVAPDGRIIATNDRLDLVVLDPEGHTIETRAIPGGAWRVVVGTPLVVPA
jgi:hypothetical protein